MKSANSKDFGVEEGSDSNFKSNGHMAKCAPRKS
jgi:hypothetical protein